MGVPGVPGLPSIPGKAGKAGKAGKEVILGKKADLVFVYHAMTKRMTYEMRYVNTTIFNTSNITWKGIMYTLYIFNCEEIFYFLIEDNQDNAANDHDNKINES